MFALRLADRSSPALRIISNHLLSKISKLLYFPLSHEHVDWHVARLNIQPDWPVKVLASCERNFKNRKIHNVSNLAFSEANCSGFDLACLALSYLEGGNLSFSCILFSRVFIMFNTPYIIWLLFAYLFVSYCITSQQLLYWSVHWLTRTFVSFLFFFWSAYWRLLACLLCLQQNVSHIIAWLRVFVANTHTHKHTSEKKIACCFDAQTPITGSDIVYWRSNKLV